MLGVKISINRLCTFFILSFLFITFSFYSLSAQIPSTANPEFWQILTPKEQAYLKKHPVLTAQSESDYAPYNYISNNKPVGFSIDYLNLLASSMGCTIDFEKNKDWDVYLTMLEDGEIDLITNIVSTPEREVFAKLSTGYFDIIDSVVIKEDRIEELKDLNSFDNKTIAVIKGFFEYNVLIKYYQKLS